jgi:hypothetical protein
MYIYIIFHQISSKICTKSEVLMTVKIHIVVLWVITLHSLVGGYQRFQGIYSFHLQG